MQPSERWVFANGLRHHVLSWGDPQSDDTIVLCHGFLDLAWGFATLAPLLARAGLYVLSCDFRGHGESDHVPAGGYYYFPDYVRDLHELSPQLCERPFHLLGHSMGGTVSALFAATHPERVRTLSLLEGLGPPAEAAARAPSRMKRWLESATAVRSQEAKQLLGLDAAYERLRARHGEVDESLLRLLSQRSTKSHPSGSGLTWRFDPLHLTPSPVAFDAERFQHFLGKIEAPTLVLDGARGLFGSEHAERRKLLRDVRYACLASAGHMLHWTHASEVAELVLSLVSEARAR